MHPQNKLSPAQIVSFRQDLLRDLRMELVQLKSCQNQIILIALAGAGVMLGLAKDQVANVGYTPFFFLLPLLILLPFWIIFFEKARTISRIIGFILVQEKLLLQNSDLGVFGWESAMVQYRKEKANLEEDYLEKIGDEKRKILKDRTEGKPEKPRKQLSESVYWITIYCVFFFLSTACIILSVKSFIDYCQYSFTTGISSGIMAPDIHFWFTNVISRDFVSLGPLAINTIHLGFFVFALVIIGFFCLAYLDEGEWKFERFRHVCFSFGIGLILLMVLVTVVVRLMVIPLNQPFLQTLTFGYWIVLVVFSVSFAVCASATLWFFKNLVRGRYSYPEFEWRWKKILCIAIDEKTGVPTVDVKCMIVSFVKEHDGEYTKETLWKDLPRELQYEQYSEIFADLLVSKKISVNSEEIVTFPK